MKKFNTTGTCRPNEHYMVDITNRLEIIRKMVDQGDYFCINRGRQYGKTTTLAALADYIRNDYCVFSISFEGLDDTAFTSASTVCAEFLKILKRHSRVNGSSGTMQALLKEVVPVGCKEIASTDFAEIIEELCTTSEKPIVVLVDEVDQASNNDGFIKFLGVLRNMFLSREDFPTFQSVILAGVYDIKNLKLKMRSEEQHQYNSPWNIAVPFDVDMSLSADGIAGMLAEYKADHGFDKPTNHEFSFDEKTVAQEIRDYTAGYPYLVSRICQIIDTEQLTWDKDGVQKAVNKMLNEGSTLFDDIVKKLDEFPELTRTIKSVLFQGMRYPFNYYDKATNLALMFNFVKQQDGAFAVACRMFEIWFYNYFISQDKQSPSFQQGMADKNQFIHDGIIDMPRLMERFAVHMNETYSMDKDARFIEDDGRKVFLTYLRPIINGVGNYYIEPQTRDHQRMDVVVDYLGIQYVIELKIWRGNAYNERGEEQLTGYLEHFNLQTGYLLSFCFNNDKQVGLLPPVKLNGRTLIEAIV